MKKVIKNVMASDLEVRIAALRCDHLIKEIPIKTTKVANTHTGIKLEYRPNEKRHNKIKTPVKTLENLVLAPEFTFKEERVSEPEAGIPENNAHPKFPIPNEIASLFSFILEPCLEARDLPIDNPSIKQRIERAKEACKIVLQICRELLMLGNVSANWSKFKDFKYTTLPDPKREV
jgi:hypothetical protein